MNNIADPSVNLVEEIQGKQTKKEVQSTVALLPSKYKDVIILHYFEGYGYEEISDILAIPTSSVGTRIRRGKQKLKDILSMEANNV